ncbi:MAG: ABC transporter ATP-binding protein [Roseitalea sp.]|jgi:peptide/nickel transport system ATP-binding protein|nr:ABC transporter ATP-binding protein [Roseitalea sp.]MBO6723181.1 ABC transporter ATP-binding protein [Roseitalea sp.]MBO6745252.1 ABC transporter ATP-binding protein [Roseitalea sp.]
MTAQAANTQPAVLSIRDLNVGYRSGRETTMVVKDVSLELEKGSTLGVVGESGSGKTTLSRAVMGLLPIASGHVELFGEDITRLDRRARQRLRRRVQMVFQDPYTSLNPTMTLQAILSEPLLVHGVGGSAERHARAAELLSLVGLDRDMLDRYPAALSGGQRQRVAIARALALSPDFIVCDEPVSALDVSIQAQILNLLKKLQQTLGLTLLFISHDLAVVRFLAHEVAVIEAGRIVEHGPCAEVMAAPRHPYTRALIDAARVRIQRGHQNG